MTQFNISCSNKFMKHSFWTFVVVLQLLVSAQLGAQCGFDTGEGCVGTDYSNAFSTSTTNRNTIEYDNFVSSFHSTIVRTSTGGFKAWGEYMNNNGSTHALSPLDVTVANYPNLTGTPLKATLGSNFSSCSGHTTDYNWTICMGIRRYCDRWYYHLKYNISKIDH